MEKSDDVWTISRIINWTAQHLKKHGSETPRLDAEILLAHAKSCRRIHLYTHHHEQLSDGERAHMRELVTRRANAEPVAYLVGHREFFSLNFRVTPDVLIPRPDTEILVLELLTKAHTLPEPRILEIGTGSGCIAVAAAVHLPHAQITATDISEAALEIAAENARKHAVDGRIVFLHGDMFSPVPADNQFDFVVSNPPYVAQEEKEHLQADVRLHEPWLALCGGHDGVQVIGRLISQSSRHLATGGYLMLEIGWEQGNVVPQLVQATGEYDGIRVVKDLAGHHRVVVAGRPG